MSRIGIIIGSTRPGRSGRAVGEWVLEAARANDSLDATYELIDLTAFELPVLDEPIPGMMGEYSHDHTRRWAATIASLDGFVFVTPEYNHSMPGALKNAIDYLFAEWNNKAAGFVSYGAQGGVRAVEHLRVTMSEVMTATVRSQVALSIFTDFDYSDADPEDPTANGRFAPADRHSEDLAEMLSQVVTWTSALAPTRQTEALQLV